MTAGYALAKPPAVLQLYASNETYVQDHDNHFCQRLQSDFTGLLRFCHIRPPDPPIAMLLRALRMSDHSRLLFQRYLYAGQDPHAKGLQGKVF